MEPERITPRASTPGELLLRYLGLARGLWPLLPSQHPLWSRNVLPMPEPHCILEANNLWSGFTGHSWKEMQDE